MAHLRVIEGDAEPYDADLSLLTPKIVLHDAKPTHHLRFNVQAHAQLSPSQRDSASSLCVVCSDVANSPDGYVQQHLDRLYADSPTVPRDQKTLLAGSVTVRPLSAAEKEDI